MHHRLLFQTLLCLILPLLILGCSHTQEIERTPEELALGEEAVLEMMDLVVQAASDRIANAERWKSVTTQLVPVAASPIFDIVDSVPGARRLLDAYLLQTHVAIASIGTQIPTFFQEKIKPTERIEDPYAIIEGNNDSLTRYFASQLGSAFELWISEQLKLEDGMAMKKAWNALIKHYNTYVIAQNQLYPDDKDIQRQTLTAQPEQTIMVSLLREFIAAMTTQEALLRTMAPAYDDPLINLFS